MKKILDAGCGYGELILTELNKRGFCYGIDSEEKFIEKAKKLNIKNAKFIVGNLENLKFKGDFFDEIYSYDVLEHVNDFEKSLVNLANVLKPNGKLILNIPHEKTENILKSLNKDYISKNMHKRIISKQQVISELKKRNFSINRIKNKDYFFAIAVTHAFKQGFKFEEESGKFNKEDFKLNLYYILRGLFELSNSRIKYELKKRNKDNFYIPFITIKTILYPLRAITSILNQIYPKSLYIEATKND